MSPKEIIDQSTAEGLSLAVSHDGNIKVVGDQNIIDEWLPLIRDHKRNIVVLLRKELKQHRALEMLENDPDKKYAVIVDDAESDPVLLTVAIRGLASFCLEIPQAYYDGIALLEVIEQHSKDTTLNLSGDTYPSPDSKECSQALPDEPQRKAA
jgi:hypothetical protein